MILVILVIIVAIPEVFIGWPGGKNCENF